MTTTYAQNIIYAYTSANDSEYDHGINWYPNANSIAREITGPDVWVGAGLLAAYSPLTPWWRTVELATKSALTGIADPASLTMNVAKAQRILDGEEVLSVLNGPKTKAFATTIVNPDTDLVTVDSHAHSVAIGRHLFTSQSKVNKTLYRAIADAYREAAELAGIQVSAMQAITWTYWRNRHYNKAARKRG